MSWHVCDNGKSEFFQLNQSIEKNSNENCYRRVCGLLHNVTNFKRSVFFSRVLLISGHFFGFTKKTSLQFQKKNSVSIFGEGICRDNSGKKVTHLPCVCAAEEMMKVDMSRN
jgi:hypothetical protein